LRWGDRREKRKKKERETGGVQLPSAFKKEESLSMLLSSYHWISPDTDRQGGKKGEGVAGKAEDLGSTSRRFCGVRPEKKKKKGEKKKKEAA